MKDEVYSFVSDVRDKKITARSARNTRTHCGKGGKVRLPHDNLSKKELNKMHGECKSYRLNDPMGWDEYKSMPDDLKVAYIKAIRSRYNAPDASIAKMLGISRETFGHEVKRIGLTVGKGAGGRRRWDEGGFYAWAHGVEKMAVPSEEEPKQEEEFMEDDLPFEIPEDDIMIDVQEAMEESCCNNPVPTTCATPSAGTMHFQCPADLALNMLSQVLGGANCQLTVSWTVLHSEGE